MHTATIEVPRHALTGLQIWALLAFLGDLATTAWAFNLGAVEANPVMQDWGIHHIILAKGAVLIALLHLKASTRMNHAALAYAGAATSVVTAWNVYAIWQAHKLGLV